MTTEIKKTEEQIFLEEIEAFCTRHDMTETAFGRKCCNNSDYVKDLRSGTSPTLRTVRRIRTWMKSKDAKQKREGNDGSGQ